MTSSHSAIATAIAIAALGEHVLKVFFQTVGFSLFLLKNLRPYLRKQAILQVKMRTNTKLLIDLCCPCVQTSSHDSGVSSSIFFKFSSFQKKTQQSDETRIPAARFFVHCLHYKSEGNIQKPAIPEEKQNKQKRILAVCLCFPICQRSSCSYNVNVLFSHASSASSFRSVIHMARTYDTR